MKSRILVLVAMLSLSSYAHAFLFCTTTMVGGARLDGAGFSNSDIRFGSRSECEWTIRNSGNGLVCLNHQNFFYSLYNIAWGEKLDSQYMDFQSCVAALKKARKGLVCATAVRRGTHKLIRIDDHAYRNFESTEECQKYLDSI